MRAGVAITSFQSETARAHLPHVAPLSRRHLAGQLPGSTAKASEAKVGDVLVESASSPTNKRASFPANTAKNRPRRRATRARKKK